MIRKVIIYWINEYYDNIFYHYIDLLVFGVRRALESLRYISDYIALCAHRSASRSGVAMRLYRLPLLLLLVLAILLPFPAQAAGVTVAVAANFVAPMRALAADFEQRSGHRVRLIQGSSGKIYAQLRQGAPFDLFFSADQSKPAALVAEGLAVADSRFTYALGNLALLSAGHPKNPDDSPLARLRRGDFDRLALANPRLAPYGAAAVAALEQMQLAASSQSRWVMGENIAQAFQFVDSGNADLGLVAMSQVLDQHIAAERYWQVPASLHAPIRQDAVLMKSARNNPVAQAFLRFVRSADAQALIADYGYHLAPQAGPVSHPVAAGATHP